MASTFIKKYGEWIYRGLSIVMSLLIMGVILYLNTHYVSRTDYKAEQALIRSDLVDQQRAVKQDLTAQQVSIKTDVQSQQIMLSANLSEFQNKNTGEHLDFFKMLAGINQTLAVINEQNKRIADHEDRLRILEKQK